MWVVDKTKFSYYLKLESNKEDVNIQFKFTLHYRQRLRKQSKLAGTCSFNHHGSAREQTAEPGPAWDSACTIDSVCCTFSSLLRCQLVRRSRISFEIYPLNIICDQSPYIFSPVSNLWSRKPSSELRYFSY